MNWRKQSSSTGFDDESIPFIPKFCGLLCACPAMLYRTKMTHTFGGATLCYINGAPYGSPGYFSRIDTSISGEWKIHPGWSPGGGTVVKSCSSEGVFFATSGVSPHCEHQEGGSYNCDPPPGFGGIPLVYTETVNHVAGGVLGPSDAVGAARSNATTNEEEWSDWLPGFPGLPGALCSDTRAGVSAGFNERTLDIEFMNFRPFWIRRREIVTTSFPGTPDPSEVDEEVIDLQITSGAPIQLVWTAEANTTRTLAATTIYLPR